MSDTFRRSLADLRLSNNVEDRRKRGAGDYEQRHRIRTAIADREYTYGIDPQATYTREQVGQWLDRNNIDDGTYLPQTEPDWLNLSPPPLPGHYMDVQPMPDITADMYPPRSLATLKRSY